MGALSSNDNSVGVLIKSDADLKGFEDTEKQLKGTEGKFADFEGGLKKASLAFAATGVALTAYSKNATDFLTGLVKDTKALSRETGISTDESSKLLAVTKRMGIEADAASTMFGIFSKQIKANNEVSGESATKQADLRNKVDATKIEIAKLTKETQVNGDSTGELKNKIEGLNLKLADYQKGLSEAAGPLSKLDVVTKNADGSARNFHDVLLDVADKFKTMPSGAEKTAVAMELFGRSGKDMLPFLNQGAQGIKDLEARASELGLTLNAKTIGAVSKYIQSSKDLKESQDAMKIAIGSVTTPVLTSLNMKLNEVIQKLIQTDGPIKTLTVSVLAFGGPVAGAISGLTAFAANLSTTGFSLGAVASSVTGLLGLLASPWTLVIGGAALILGTLIFGTQSANSATDQLKAAQDRLAQSSTALKTAQSDLANEQLRAESTALQVERGQNNYNEAVRRFGPASLEAREALNQLKVAEQGHKDALQAVEDKQKSVNDKTREFKEASKDVENAKGFVGAMAERSRAMDEFKAKADAATGSLSTFRSSSQVNTDKNMGLIDKSGKSISSPGYKPFAKGVRNFSGGMALVGEEGPEFINLPRGADVYTNGETKKMMNTGQGVTLNQTNHIYNDIDIRMANEELGWRLQNA